MRTSNDTQAPPPAAGVPASRTAPSIVDGMHPSAAALGSPVAGAAAAAAARAAAATLVNRGSASGVPLLVLHGGGGPGTIAPIAVRYAHAHAVFSPTLPGWDGTPLPDAIDGIPSLAGGYLEALRAADLDEVIVIGSSLGGWLALEMAATAATDPRYAGVIAGIVVIDSTGIAVDGERIADVFELDARGLAEVAWHDASLGYRDPATLTAAQRDAQLGNQRTMRRLAGDPYMHDPALASRLAAIITPALVVWGASDGVVTPEYGRAMAQAIPNSAFTVIERAGHLPQLERPEALWEPLDPFIACVSGHAAKR